MILFFTVVLLYFCRAKYCSAAFCIAALIAQPAQSAQPRRASRCPSLPRDETVLRQGGEPCHHLSLEESQVLADAPARQRGLCALSRAALFVDAGLRNLEQISDLLNGHNLGCLSHKGAWLGVTGFAFHTLSPISVSLTATYDYFSIVLDTPSLVNYDCRCGNHID
jgi:hypothetical protein